MCERMNLSSFEVYLDFFFFFFLLFRAVPAAYGGSWARGLGAVAIGLHHSHSNIGSEPHL